MVSTGYSYLISVQYFCRTPLHYAAANVHQQCVHVLLNVGSNVNLTDRHGCTPLHYAAAADIDAKYD